METVAVYTHCLPGNAPFQKRMWLHVRDNLMTGRTEEVNLNKFPLDTRPWLYLQRCLISQGFLLYAQGDRVHTPCDHPYLAVRLTRLPWDT